MAYPYNDRNKGYNSRMQQQTAPKRLPSGYLSGGYYEGDGQNRHMKKEYIVQYSKQIADDLSDDGRGKKNKRSQIRKFYEYTIQVRELVRRKDNCFAVAEAELNRLIPFVRYAESRDTVSELFGEFIEKNVKAVHDVEDLDAFLKHFEAIVAYLPKEKN